MFGLKLLGINLELSKQFKEALMEGNEVLKVGYTRINFSYFWEDKDIEYLLQAVEFVAKYGWMMLPHY
jgi:hypothetical protein